jgi:hypothetical protein
MNNTIFLDDDDFSKELFDLCKKYRIIGTKYSPEFIEKVLINQINLIRWCDGTKKCLKLNEYE